MISIVDIELKKWLRDYESREKLRPASPFSDEERTEEARKKRIEKARNDFWYFDSVYFPPAVYKQGYSEPAEFHKDIFAICQEIGVHVIAGPRKHGKTATGRKILLWKLLFGHINFAATYSEDLDVARSWLRFIYIFLTRGRVADDFNPEITIISRDHLEFRTFDETKTLKPFSQKRSLRGQLEEFDRPQEIYGDDVETKDSSMDFDAVRNRIDRITEGFESLDNSTAKFIIFANNFDRRCMTNTLLMQQNEGILNEGYQVHIYKAWNEKTGSLWFSAYPARTEAELKNMLMVRDQSNWFGNYQQDPQPPSGNYFSEDHYATYDELPSDCIGVIYTDQNLAKKSKGDTTAIVKLLHSKSTNKLYVHFPRCKSYSNSKVLFEDIIDMFNSKDSRIIGIGFDGNVTQESYWSELMAAYSNFEHIRFLQRFAEFKKYNVSDIATNAQLLYVQGELLFPKSFGLTKEGTTFLTQFFAFTGTKLRGKKDDAPDALICALQFMFEMGLSRLSARSSNVSVNYSISDYYKI